MESSHCRSEFYADGWYARRAVPAGADHIPSLLQEMPVIALNHSPVTTRDPDLLNSPGYIAWASSERDFEVFYSARPMINHKNGRSPSLGVRHLRLSHPTDRQFGRHQSAVEQPSRIAGVASHCDIAARVCRLQSDHNPTPDYEDTRQETSHDRNSRARTDETKDCAPASTLVLGCTLGIAQRRLRRGEKAMQTCGGDVR